MYKVQDFFQPVDRILISRVTCRLIGSNIPHYKLWTFPQNIEHSVIRVEIRGVAVISILVFTGESILWRQTGRDNLSRVLSRYQALAYKTLILSSISSTDSYKYFSHSNIFSFIAGCTFIILGFFMINSKIIQRGCFCHV